ncbi:hypothetical protein ACFOEY_00070 [Paracandidimonas soli]|uniref:hypothetical protein n=1 Tax=Paracandidimonas soli TaxID=1917182 RepID=UPI00361F2A11
MPKYAALVAWAEVNGHMQTSGAWVKGAFHFASLGETVSGCRICEISSSARPGLTLTLQMQGSSEPPVDAFQGTGMIYGALAVLWLVMEPSSSRRT